jgi:GNAT superfamily N-acetyltransferase
MSKIIIEEYKRINGEFDTKMTNFRIKSLARRNKFYYNAIVRVFENGNIFNGNDDRRIILAKQIIGKREKIIGFVVFNPTGLWGNRSKCMSCEIDYWMVDKKFRGQGIGKKLYDAVIDETTEYSIHNMTVLFDGRDENLRKIYAGMGYIRIDSYRGVKTEIEEQQRNKEHLIRWWKIGYDNMTFGEQIVKLVY